MDDHDPVDPAHERDELLHQLRLWNRQIVLNGAEPPLHIEMARHLPLDQLRTGVHQTADYLLGTFRPEDH